ncbi:hypothetical protein GWI33_023109, partial [Rhynchophorus ferrugineus]
MNFSMFLMQLYDHVQPQGLTAPPTFGIPETLFSDDKSTMNGEIDQVT